MVDSDYRKNIVLPYLISIPFKREAILGTSKIFIDVTEVAISISPSSPNSAKFIEAVKIIIDFGEDVRNGFSLTFNGSYTKLKKSLLQINTNQSTNRK